MTGNDPFVDLVRTMRAPSLDDLCTRLGGDPRRWPDRRGRYHGTCPKCGKPPFATSGYAASHWSIYPSGAGFAHKCFACDYGGSLTQLLIDIDEQPLARTPVRHSAPRKPPNWQREPDAYLERVCGALDTYTAWISYKPLSLATLARFRLGVGRLPASRCEHRRLILPVFDAGKLVALHGRAFQAKDPDAKWLTAGGSTKGVLYNADLLTRGCTVIICENMVDTLLAMQETPGIVAVAGGGVAWREEWSAQIAAARPQRVIVWLDNDTAGHDNAAKIAMCLWRGGVRSVTPYRWPNDAPPKADLGWAMMQRGGCI